MSGAAKDAPLDTCGAEAIVDTGDVLSQVQAGAAEGGAVGAGPVDGGQQVQQVGCDAWRKLLESVSIASRRSLHAIAGCCNAAVLRQGLV